MKRNRPMIAIYCAVALAIGLNGCGGYELGPNEATQSGAALGAVTGAIVGYNTKGHHKGQRAAIGAALGAAAGGLAGHAVESQNPPSINEGGWE